MGQLRTANKRRKRVIVRAQKRVQADTTIRKPEPKPARNPA